MYALGAFKLASEARDENLPIERPGLESQRSRKRLFFHRKISNSSNFYLILIKMYFLNFISKAINLNPSTAKITVLVP